VIFGISLDLTCRTIIRSVPFGIDDIEAIFKQFQGRSAVKRCLRICKSPVLTVDDNRRII
jgi:hypothetical protein